MWKDKTVLMLCLTVFLSYLPEAGKRHAAGVMSWVAGFFLTHTKTGKTYHFAKKFPKCRKVYE
jgi:hypothetical protein